MDRRLHDKSQCGGVAAAAASTTLAPPVIAQSQSEDQLARHVVLPEVARHDLRCRGDYGEFVRDSTDETSTSRVFAAERDSPRPAGRAMLSRPERSRWLPHGLPLSTGARTPTWALATAVPFSLNCGRWTLDVSMAAATTCSTSSSPRRRLPGWPAQYRRADGRMERQGSALSTISRASRRASAASPARSCREARRRPPQQIAAATSILR